MKKIYIINTRIIFLKKKNKKNNIMPVALGLKKTILSCCPLPFHLLWTTAHHFWHIKQSYWQVVKPWVSNYSVMGQSIPWLCHTKKKHIITQYVNHRPGQLLIDAVWSQPSFCYFDEFHRVQILCLWTETALTRLCICAWSWPSLVTYGIRDNFSW